jgi:hypothetical protein
MCSHMVGDRGSILSKGGDLYVFKVVSFLLILPPTHCKYMVLSPVLNGLIYNTNHLLTTTADVYECLQLPLNLNLCLHGAGLIMKWDKFTLCITLQNTVTIKCTNNVNIQKLCILSTHFIIHY